MQEALPLFLHLFARRPEDFTYDEWLNCKNFADEWLKAQREGG